MTGAFLACGILSPSRSILYEGSQGSILLEQVPERGTTAGFRSTSGLQASHPVILEPVILAAALQGLSISAPPKSGAIGETPAVTPMFHEEDVAFLAPLLSTALTKATPSQYVRFHLHHRSLPNDAREQTSGALYVYGRSLHLTLTAYRVTPQRPETAQMANRKIIDPTGLAGRIVSFTPPAALRSDSYRRAVLPLSDDLPSLVIDYQALQAVKHTRPAQPPTPSTPAPSTSASRPPDSAPLSGDIAPAATPSGTSEVRDLKELVIKKDLELERLREEIQRLKQDNARTTMPATGKPPAKKPLPPKSGTP